MNQYPDYYLLMPLVSRQYAAFINASTGDAKRFQENLKAKNFINGSVPIYEPLHPKIS